MLRHVPSEDLLMRGVCLFGRGGIVIEVHEGLRKFFSIFDIYRAGNRAALACRAVASENNVVDFDISGIPTWYWYDRLSVRRPVVPERMLKIVGLHQWMRMVNVQYGMLSLFKSFPKVD